MVKTAILSLLAVTASAALAQAPTGELPADVQALMGDALKARLVGKTFDYVVPKNPATFRLQYNDSGYVFLNGPNNLSDSAAWRIEGSKVCTEWKRIPAGCTEVRVKGELMYVERSDGSWGTMTLR